jgi:S-formylglutathione hydrolase FrmB
VLLSDFAAAGQQQKFDAAFQSAALSQFFQQPVEMHATVLLPDSYYTAPTKRYPTIYVIPAFGESYEINSTTQLAWQGPMRSLGAEFIIVFLQGMVSINGEELHNMFADSVNDGPWGTALTSEFIPNMDARYRTVGTPATRFLFGHSSGGWSVLWLQVNYPEIFNGEWSVSPDPVDFHDFLGADIAKVPVGNFYKDAAGNAYDTCRERGHDTRTLRDLIVDSRDCGDQLGQPFLTSQKPWPARQMDTYDEVFSSRQPDGTPARLFDRKTGAIDPDVARYWEEHYDVTRILRDRWSTLSAALRGKLHVFVGTEDTFHLEGSVSLMRDALSALGSDAEFVFARGDDHWQILTWHDGLVRYSLHEMAQRATTLSQ